jgi:hypothetical protein
MAQTHARSFRSGDGGGVVCLAFFAVAIRIMRYQRL